MRKNRKRIIAAIMTALMVLTLVPTWLLGGVFATTAKAENKTYTYSAAEDSSWVQSANIADSTTIGTDNFFKIISAADGKAKYANSSTHSIEFHRDGTGSLEFVVPTNTTANVTMSIGASGSGTAFYELADSSGQAVAQTSGADGYKLTSSTATTVKYSSLPAGKYVFKGLSTYSAESADKNLRLYSISVETTSAAAATGTQPVVSAVNAVVNEETGKIDISWTASTEAEGDGKYEIYVNDGTTAVKTVAAGEEKNYSYAPGATGTYTFTVKGVLGDNKNAGVTSSQVSYKLELAKATAKAERVAEDGSKIKVSCDGVKEAESYVANIYEADGKTLVKSNVAMTVDGASGKASVEIDGLTEGSKYFVEIIAKRGTETTTSDKVSVRPYKTIDMNEAIPSMKVVNTTESKATVAIERDNGTINVSQSSGSSSKVASGGVEKGSFIVAEATDKDFTISADVKITSIERTTTSNQQGLYIGAFGELKEKCVALSTAELGTNDKAYAAYCPNGKVARTGETAATVGNKYSMSVTRTGGTYTIVIKDSSGNAIVNYEDTSANAELGEGKSVIPAIAVIGVSAEITNLKLVVAGETKIDSTTFTGSFSPYIDNWSTVDAPTLSIVENKAEAELNTVYVKVNCDMSVVGASKVTVFMKDANGKTLGKKECVKDGGEVSFQPEASGTYYFIAMATRNGETDSIFSEELVSHEFTLKMTKPELISITNAGNYSVQLRWAAVTEAQKYQVSYSSDNGVTYSTPVDVTDTVYVVKGLSAGKYKFKITAVNGSDVSEAAETETNVTAEAETEWMYSAFGGSNATTDNGKNGHSGNPNDSNSTVKVNSGIVSSNALGGKLVTGTSPDEISYFYTQLSSDMNFTLKAKVHIDALKEDGGQVGFGLMASDTVGESSTGRAYYTNSVATYAGKLEYYYDEETQAVTSDSTKTKYSLYEGIGARYKVGSADTSSFGNGSVMLPLSLDANGLEPTTKWNVLDGDTFVNATGTTIEGTGYKDFYLTLTKDNTGFLCIYSDADGKEISRQRIYDLDNEYLTTIDKDNYYVGFFAARCAEISFTNITFTTIKASDDAEAEGVEYTLITPKAEVTTTSTTGSADYELQFVANADGVVTITAPNGEVVVDNQHVSANEVVKAPSYTLSKGKNDYGISFTPDEGYEPGKYQKLSSYDTIEFTYTVTYKTIGESGQSIWISPDGTGDGSKSNPTDIYTAIKYVQANQQIVVTEGTYKLESTVKVARGISGKEDAMIYLIADPSAKTRPVFDFQKACAGFIFAGDYWYVKGFDVINSADKCKAVQVSGNHNTLDQINVYNNGDTGIQISRYLPSDSTIDMWPSYNTILNCTSYNNADPTYADADGFAAKITVGVGNVFDGCISHHNADDGWDFFAYPDTGAIGKVTIKNSVAYSNGYVIKDADGNLDINGGNVIDAGNGNGFKMGGNSITGYHTIENSISFENKAKGIDCNSCPDIQVKNCTTFNNGSYNIALYSGSAKNTDFSATGVISYRSADKAVTVIDTDGDYVDTTGNKGIKMVGNQDVSKVINNTSYFWMGSYVPELSGTFNDLIMSLNANTNAGYGSYNAAGNKVSDAWFESLDTSKGVTRNADGSINMNGVLVLTAAADPNAGARMTNTLSAEIAVYPTVTGDSSNMFVWIMIALGAVAVAGAGLFFGKRRMAR